MMRFESLSEAVRQGFMVSDRLVGGGYILKQMTDKGWAMAVCEPKDHHQVLTPESAFDQEC